MLRFILLVTFIVMLAIGFLVIMGALRAVTGGAPEKDSETMPSTFRRISYVVLLVLMFGVTSGWLGAA